LPQAHVYPGQHHGYRAEQADPHLEPGFTNHSETTRENRAIEEVFCMDRSRCESIRYREYVVSYLTGQALKPARLAGVITLQRLENRFSKCAISDSDAILAPKSVHIFYETKRGVWVA